MFINGGKLLGGRTSVPFIENTAAQILHSSDKRTESRVWKISDIPLLGYLNKYRDQPVRLEVFIIQSASSCFPGLSQSLHRRRPPEIPAVGGGEAPPWPHAGLDPPAARWHVYYIFKPSSGAADVPWTERRAFVVAAVQISPHFRSSVPLMTLGRKPQRSVSVPPVWRWTRFSGIQIYLIFS